MSKCDDSSNSMVWVGWIGVAIAVAFFGSNFIPVKKFDTGDGNTSVKLSPSLSPSLPLSPGMFFQWVLCIGIWLVGLVVNIARLQPPFFLPTLLGGFLWTTGNKLCAGLEGPLPPSPPLSLSLPLSPSLPPGNLMAVPVIKLIGLTMGLTTWGVTNMLSGWFTGK